MTLHDSFPGPPFDPSFYTSLVEDRRSWTATESAVIQVEDGGGAIVVPAGSVLRVTCLEGPQISDMCIWNAHDPTERLWNDQTLNHEGIHLTTMNRLWGNMPHFRPLMTIIADTVESRPTRPLSRHHCILAAHCNPHNWYWTFGGADHEFIRYNCWTNLAKAIEPFDLGPDALHDNLNLFQKIGYDPATGRGFMEPSDAKAGDYVEFFAEIDVLVALTICPSGSGRLPDDHPTQDRTPLGLAVFKTDRLPPPRIDVAAILGLVPPPV
jgi:uncharacterized protein YcgI (DUF1989 family)